MFIKSKKTDEQPVRNEGLPPITDSEQISGDGQTARIIDGIIKFTGAKNLDELEEILSLAEKNDSKDREDEDSKLFDALSSIRNSYSLLEAKEMENNEDFVKAVAAGFEPERAYKLARCDELIANAYAEGEEHGKTVALAREDRIGEEGISTPSGIKAEIDPKKMSMDDLKKIKERLRKGENVRL